VSALTIIHAAEAAGRRMSAGSKADLGKQKDRLAAVSDIGTAKNFRLSPAAATGSCIEFTTLNWMFRVSPGTGTLPLSKRFY